MKLKEVYITSALAGLSILLVIALFTLNKANQGITRSIQAQQNVINQGRVGEQVGQAVVRDMAALSVQNEKIKTLLANNGFNVTRNPAPQQEGN
ncbi:MAG: hypothetical protein AAF649_12155 [Verrucomicrobiota bacterium]